MLTAIFNFITRRTVAAHYIDERIRYSHKIYLGHDIPAGPLAGRMSTDEFDSFLAKFLVEVADKRLEFYTLTTCTGRYGKVSETTTVLEVISENHGIERNIQLVAKAYKQWFSQESVMYTKTEIETVEFM